MTLLRGAGRVFLEGFSTARALLFYHLDNFVNAERRKSYQNGVKNGSANKPNGYVLFCALCGAKLLAHVRAGKFGV